MGADVRISRVAVAQGNLTLRVDENPLSCSPNPFAEGETVVVPPHRCGHRPGWTGLAEITGGTSLSEVVAGPERAGRGPAMT